ncbi:TPM domain-containing protein [Paenibacillus sp. FSL R7-0333]|uniref:TPM domain-containing protein n=1 Tax=Paenibacillus sp. FSL R7-0333 TaxID=1926587 RepID=UPI0009FAFBA7
MRKNLTLALVLILSLLWIPGVYAANVPAQQGVITDEARLLSAQEAESLARIATTDRYTFHVLTVDSVAGSDMSSYAADVYDTWGLKSRDILLLIAYEDQLTEISFINPGLQDALDAWSIQQGGAAGSAAINKVLEKYFNPYARNGDIPEGIRSVIQQLQAIGSSGPSSNTGSGAAGGANAGTAGAGSGPNGSGSRFPLLPVAGGLVLAALLILLLYVLITGMRRRKGLSAQREQLADLLVRANRALESLQPFQGIVQGKTGERVEGISKRLTSRLVEISALQTAGQAPLPPFYRLSALKAAAEQLQQTEGEFRASLEEEEKNIAVVSEADRNVKQQITELKQAAPELEEQRQQAALETGYTLEEIAQDLQELAEETAKADQLELFDPIAAQEITAQAKKRQQQIEQDVQDVGTFDDKLKAFPGVLAAARSRIAGLIDQNSLHNMKVKPYDSLDQASAAASSMEAPLHSGDMDEVRRIGADMDALLTEAVAMTERQAMIRQNNLRDLETVRSTWATLSQRRNELQSRLAEAKNRFARQHLDALEKLLEEAGGALRQGAAEVPQLETWTSDARGEYDNARSGLDRLLALQDETANSMNSISSSLDALEERVNSLNRLFTEGQSRVDAAYNLLHSRGIASQNRFQLSLLPEYTELEQRLASGPYDLDQLEETGRSYASQIASFVEEANRLVRQKEEAERAARMAMLREQQRREQARRRNSGPPGGGFGGGLGGGGRSSGGSSWGGGGGGGRSSGGSSFGGGKSGRSSGGSKW